MNISTQFFKNRKILITRNLRIPKIKKKIFFENRQIKNSIRGITEIKINIKIFLK